MRYGDQAATDNDLARRLSEMLGRDLTDEDEIDDVPSGEAEEIESEVADAATAARTIAELDKELAILADLAEVARRVRHSGTDRKWTELRDLLTDNTLIMFFVHTCLVLMWSLERSNFQGWRMFVSSTFAAHSGFTR